MVYEECHPYSSVSISNNVRWIQIASILRGVIGFQSLDDCPVTLTFLSCVENLTPSVTLWWYYKICVIGWLEQIHIISEMPLGLEGLSYSHCDLPSGKSGRSDFCPLWVINLHCSSWPLALRNYIGKIQTRWVDMTVTSIVSARRRRYCWRRCLSHFLQQWSQQTPVPQQLCSHRWHSDETHGG